MIFLLALLAVSANDDRAFAIGQEIRCPVCQGMPIAESPSPMAQDMMKRVRVMLDEGKSRQEILEYFVQRYGEWVVLNPKAEGLGILVWVLPVVFTVLGLWLILRYVKR